MTPLTPRRFKRHARRWTSCAIVALSLLATSQMLWAWQTWKLRTLLAVLMEGG